MVHRLCGDLLCVDRGLWICCEDRQVHSSSVDVFAERFEGALSMLQVICEFDVSRQDQLVRDRVHSRCRQSVPLLCSAREALQQIEANSLNDSQRYSHTQPKSHRTQKQYQQTPQHNITQREQPKIR